MNLYISAPALNDAQVRGVSKLLEAAEASGFEVLNPLSISALEPDGKTPRSSTDFIRERLQLLAEADVVLAWLDTLQMPGHYLFLLRNIQRRINIPLPKQLVDLMSLALQASGQAQHKPKDGLTVPGRDDPSGMEIATIPKELTVDLTNSPVVVGELPSESSSAINFPDSNVVFEIGQARPGGFL